MLDRLADVLVIGGGPAGAWAAVAAAEAGATVALVDKGYLGTSGATAPSNTGTWFVPPERRRAAVEQRQPRTGGLADPRWVERTLDTAWDKLHCLAGWGYPFPDDDQGRPYLANLRGPDYMHFMRRRVLGAGVTVLDHHPALELLATARPSRGCRYRPPAPPAVADPSRRRGAGDRRLRLRRAHAGSGGADRRRLPDGRRGRRRAVGDGVLGTVRVHPEAERAQQGPAVSLGELHPARRHRDLHRRPRPAHRGGRGLAGGAGLLPSTTGLRPRCDRGSDRVSRTASCRSIAAESSRSPSAGP